MFETNSVEISGREGNIVHFHGNLDDLVALVKNRAVLVVINFLIDWCGPCRNLVRQLFGTADQYPGVKLMKGNFDENQEIARVFNVKSVPHTRFVKGLNEEEEIQVFEVVNGTNIVAINARIEKYQ
jgi:thiol-disulfide isomerase/thioredoxin